MGSGIREKGLSEVLIFVFFIGTVWELFTTFLGIVYIVGGKQFTLSIPNFSDINQFGVYGMAIVGSVIVFGFNLSTHSIWKEAREGVWTWVALWFPCVLFDFFTALAGNYRLVPSGRIDNMSTNAVVWFVTILVTISPMMLRYLIVDYSED